MLKLLWYPWKWEQWRASFPVLQLSLAERGLYRELLDASWKVGGLPNDPAELAQLARCKTSDFSRCWKAVRRFWKSRADGLLYNDELEEIRVEQVEAHTRRVEAGKKGGRRPTKAMLSNAKQSLAIEKSRVETTLTTRAGGVRKGTAHPAPLSYILASSMPDLRADPPTSEQLADLAAVKEALRS